MAVQFPNFLSAQLVKPDYSGLANIFENVLKGYQIQREPTKIRQEELMREFENQLKQQQAQYYGPNIESEMALRGAQTGRIGLESEQLRDQIERTKENPLFGQPGVLGQIGALMYLKSHPDVNQAISGSAAEGYNIPQMTKEEIAAGKQGIIPELSTANQQDFTNMLSEAIRSSFKGKEAPLSGPAREAADLLRVKKQFGEESDDYKLAKALYDAKLASTQELTQQRKRRGEGLRAGEYYTYDEQGKKTGVSQPLSNKEREQEEGRTFFNEVYPVVQKASLFSGVGSIRALENAAKNYNTNPAARQAFDDFLLAQKALTSAVVSEASTLGAGKTNQTYKQLKESLQSHDIPEKIESLIKKYQLPASAQQRAAQRFQSLINSAREKAIQSVPARRVRPLEETKEESSKENKKTKESEPVERSISVEGKTYDLINGEWYERRKKKSK